MRQSPRRRTGNRFSAIGVSSFHDPACCLFLSRLPIRRSSGRRRIFARSLTARTTHRPAQELGLLMFDSGGRRRPFPAWRARGPHGRLGTNRIGQLAGNRQFGDRRLRPDGFARWCFGAVHAIGPLGAFRPVPALEAFRTWLATIAIAERPLATTLAFLALAIRAIGPVIEALFARLTRRPVAKRLALALRAVALEPVAVFRAVAVVETFAPVEALGPIPVARLEAVALRAADRKSVV